MKDGVAWSRDVGHGVEMGGGMEKTWERYGRHGGELGTWPG